MLGWFKRKAQISIAKTYNEDLDRYIAMLIGSSRSELGSLVANATHKRHALRKQEIDLLNPVEAEARDMMIAYKLNRLVADAQKTGSPIDAAGWMPWLHTIRAANTIEVRYKGQLMWAELSRGFSFVEEAAADWKHAFDQDLNIDGFSSFPEGLEPDHRDL